MVTTDGVVDDGRHRTDLVFWSALAGLLAGAAFGILVQFSLQRMTAIGAMYTLGDPSLGVGWVGHLVHSVVFGTLFGVVVDRPPFRDRVSTYHGSLGLAVLYSVLLWSVNVVFLWPLWLNQLGVGTELPLPNLAVVPLVGHVVYGTLLGLGIAVMVRISDGR
ncbi:hypothetical protein [Haloarchaeobius sp. HRN-SO-5]|uniref:hypothetical protein n=1 Tax=Haloarchaeobius sp. HRN-SO-5 TaxID=3446118 RepID=UPI003EBDAC64